VEGPAAPPPVPRAGEMAFADDYELGADGWTALGMLDDLLKRPGRVSRAVTDGPGGVVWAGLLLVTAACLAGYGAIMGGFSGGWQYAATPLKTVAGLLAAAVICAPSLYIFSCLSGGRQTLRQTLGLLLQMLALCAFLLLGFAPIAWVFSQATRSAAFMGAMHVVFWTIAVSWSVRVLRLALRHFGARGGGGLRLWAVLFLAVVFQMSVTLRPLISEYRGPGLMGRKFFLQHWTDCMR